MHMPCQILRHYARQKITKFFCWRYFPCIPSFSDCHLELSQSKMQVGHLLFSSLIHFSMSPCRSTSSVFTKRPACNAPVRIFCKVSRFLQFVGWSHWLQSFIFLLEAQALISQFGLPIALQTSLTQRHGLYGSKSLRKFLEVKVFGSPLFQTIPLDNLLILFCQLPQSSIPCYAATAPNSAKTNLILHVFKRVDFQCISPQTVLPESRLQK